MIKETDYARMEEILKERDRRKFIISNMREAMDKYYWTNDGFEVGKVPIVNGRSFDDRWRPKSQDEIEFLKVKEREIYNILEEIVEYYERG